MFFYLSTFPFVAVAIMFWGLIALRQIGGVDALRVSEFNRPHDLMFCAAWLGVSIVAGILTLWALVAPVTVAATLGVLLAGPVLAVSLPQCRRSISTLVSAPSEPKRLAPLLTTWLLIVLPVVYVGSQPIIYFDTAFYHLPVARILETYGAIKGMIGIHMNFGQASSWFSLAAPGTLGGEIGWGAQSANVYFAMLAATQAAFMMQRLLSGSSDLADWIAGLGLTFVLLLGTRWGMIASLSPDLPAMLLAVIVAWLLCNKNLKPSVFVALPIAAFAVTIKLSTAPLAAVAAFAAIPIISQEWRKFLASAALSVAIIIIFASIGILSSGCFAFPASFSCLDLPWTPTSDQLTSHTTLIINAARGGGRELPSDTSTLDGFLIWTSRDTSGAVIVLGGLVVLAYLTFRRLASKTGNHAGTWPLLLALAGLAYVATLAPSGRFGGGYTAILIALLAFRFKPIDVDQGMPILLKSIPAVIAILIIVVQSSGPGNLVRTTISNQVATGELPFLGSGIILPKRILPFAFEHPTASRLREWKEDGMESISGSYPTGSNECWAAPPPCFPRGNYRESRYIDPNKGFAGGLATRTEN